MVAPSEFCDANGDYRGADGQVHKNPGYTTYTTFSLWDTYRTAMPLMTLLHPDRMPDIINTMLAIADEQGRLPVWHLWGNETDCMVGNPGIPVVADAIVKGIGGFDREHAFEAIRKTAMNPDRGNGLRMKFGYIPCDLFNEAVAYDMEYALADGATARAAKALGKEEDEAYFTKRSHSYRHYFDPSTGFMRGRDSRGGWRTPFNPFASTHRADDYCEGNAWHYNWSVFHDVQGLINLYGSDEAFTAKIDSVFTVPNVIRPGTYGGMIHEMKEMELAGMGQYAHGNQPIQHMIYLYSYAGQPWKTQYWSRQITGRLYNSSERGYPGDEDQGGMSSWYILSSLGIYSVCPGTDQYVLGSPVFRKATITMEDGRKFVIEADGNSQQNVYIQSATLNGKPLDKNYITYKDIADGGVMRLVMGPEPNKERGTGKDAAPFSLSRPE
jgi:predicted alpha-1,2-mannosidase